MPDSLWQWEELVAAAQGAADGKPVDAVTGISIDTRSLRPGDLFVALRDARDGHDFVTEAFANGAAAALVAKEYARKDADGALLRVADPLRALENVARCARARLGADAKLIAVTGSAGKTGTKEMLRACLSAVGPTHASEKSYNNHWGVPLTLARMPASTRFGVFEIGMNHAGEITPLTAMVAPHVAIVTTVAAVHIGHFASEEDIADAKAEIFSGVVPGGTGLLPRDNRHFERLRAAAETCGLNILSFGAHESADVRPVHLALGDSSTDLAVVLPGGDTVQYHIGIPGRHVAMNSLAVAAALEVVGADASKALAALASQDAPEGRGARIHLPCGEGEILLIDESYNANPASMRAALATLALVPRARFPRRIAVLGDMLELGEGSRALHIALADAIEEANVDLVFACGPDMFALFHALPVRQRGLWAAESKGISATVADLLRPGDAVMVKGSLGSRMAPVVAEITNRFGGTVV